MFKTKIGFIPSHWDPWGDEWAESMRDRCVKVLESIPGTDLVVPSKELTGDGCVRNLEQARKTLELFQKEKVEGIILGNMTFGQEISTVGTIISGLPENLPVIHFATKGAPIKKDGIRLSDAWCGQFMMTSAMRRRDIKFEHIPTCWPEENVFRENVEIFVRTCTAISNFKHARFGQLGVRPELFESVWCDEAILQKKFKQILVPMDLNEVLTRIENVPKNSKTTKKIVEEIKEGIDYREVLEEAIVNLARCEIAFVDIVKEKELQGLAVNCWTGVQRRIGISICSVLGRLNDRGIITACEVDVYGLLSMWAAYLATLGKVKPFFIDWTDLHPTEPNTWLAWHCGNAPRSLCMEGCKPCLKKHSTMWVDTSYGTLEFKIKTGKVTCSRLVEYNGEFTMFLGKGETVDIPPFTRGTYGWVKVNDVLDWEKKLVENGIVHHGVLIHDPKVFPALESFCKFLGIKVVKAL